MTEPFDVLLKVLIVGDSGVGKSCLLARFSDEEYEEGYRMTIGVDFKIKTISSDEKKYKLQLWDTAGQERFRAISSCHYRGSHIVLIAYDTTALDSFQKLDKWKQEVERYCGNDNVVLGLVGTKTDLTDQRRVTEAMGKEYALKHGFLFSEVSAKTGDGVENTFTRLVQYYQKTAPQPDEHDDEEPQVPKPVITVGPKKEEPPKPRWRCVLF